MHHKINLRSFTTDEDGNVMELKEVEDEMDGPRG